MSSDLIKVSIKPVTHIAPNFLIAPLGDGCLLRGGAMVDLTQFSWTDGAAVFVGAAGAASNATTIPLKLPYPVNAIPSGTVLYFNGSKKFALTTTAAAAAATSLTVQALPTALVENDTATYKGTTGIISIPAGTLLGRTYAERDAGTAFGPASDSDDELYLSVYTVVASTASEDVMTISLVDLLSHNEQIAENRLPGWSNLSSTLKTKIRSLYQTRVV